MPHLEGEIINHRPVEEVFDFVAHERNEPLYHAEMRECELISERLVQDLCCFTKGEPQ